jgi:hypothetical protein
MGRGAAGELDQIIRTRGGRLGLGLGSFFRRLIIGGSLWLVGRSERMRWA